MRSTNLTSWVNAATNVAPTGTVAQASVAITNTVGFYRTTRTAIAAHDPVTNASVNGIVSIVPNAGTTGTQVIATITLDSTATPSPPPIAAPVQVCTIGTVAATGTPTRPTQYTINATFNIPAGTAPGLKTVTVQFPGPPENMAATVTYTLPNGFTVQ